MAEDLKEATQLLEEDGDPADDLFQEEPESPKRSKDPEEWEEGPPEDHDDEGDPGPKEGEDKKDADKPDLEKKVEELQEQGEYVTIYVARPMRRRTGPATLTAVQDIVLQLRKAGLPVRNIHSDRAREFRTVQFRTWLSEQQISQTRTSGGDPAGNSTAEIGVKWFKGRTRALLKGASAPPTEWPLAAQHAVARLWRQAFPASPLYPKTMASFGQVVWFRAKLTWGSRKEVGRHRQQGPSNQVEEGVLQRTFDGGL